MGHALRGGGAEVELSAVGGGVCSARWLGHGTLPWWRRREGRRRSEGYPGAGVGARGTLGRREGASRGGGVSGEPHPALGAGAADRVRYGCKVDRSREEFGSDEILASHEDHVGSGNEGRAEHLELAERGGPGGPRRARKARAGGPEEPEGASEGYPGAARSSARGDGRRVQAPCAEASASGSTAAGSTWREEVDEDGRHEGGFERGAPDSDGEGARGGAGARGPGRGRSEGSRGARGASRGGGVWAAPGQGRRRPVRYGWVAGPEVGRRVLASHEDHVGSGNEGRAEHLELATSVADREDRAEREGARGGAGARGTLERASERGVPWGAARVHHAEVVSRASHTRR